MSSALRLVALRGGLRAGSAAANEANVLVGRGVCHNGVSRVWHAVPNGLRFQLLSTSSPSSSGAGALRTQQQTRGFAVTAATWTPAAAGTKKPATKKKTAVKKKPAAKKKAKKVVAKKKAPRKVKTPEEKKKLEIRALKKTALFSEPAKLADRPWIVFVTENTKGTKPEGGLSKVMPELSQAFKALSPFEQQRLRDTAEKNRVANEAVLKAWVESHSAAEIADANVARQRLNRLANPKSKHRSIKDERQPKRPLSSFSIFTKERWESGMFAGRPIGEATKMLAAEWKGMTPSEREEFDNRSKTESERYELEVKSVLGRSVAKAAPAPSP